MTDLIRRTDFDDTARLELGLLGALVTAFTGGALAIAALRLDTVLVQVTQTLV